MVKNDVVTAIAEKTGLMKKQVAPIVDALMESVREGLETDGNVTLMGFGSFKIVDRAAREGVNPATGEPMHIEASKAIKFKAGSALKDAVKGE